MIVIFTNTRGGCLLPWKPIRMQTCTKVVHKTLSPNQTLTDGIEHIHPQYLPVPTAKHRYMMLE